MALFTGILLRLQIGGPEAGVDSVTIPLMDGILPGPGGHIPADGFPDLFGFGSSHLRVLIQEFLHIFLEFIEAILVMADKIFIKKH